MPGPGPLSIGKELGNAILTFLYSRAEITALNLLQFGWFKNLISPGSAYPTNPYLQCPRLMLRYEGISIQPGPPRGGTTAKVTYAYSLFYYKRQNVKEEHQQLFANDVESIVSVFTSEAFHPSLIEMVAGFQNWSLVPVQVSYHDEMKHDFDDPNLRISVAELSLRAEGYISNCNP